MNTLDWDDLYEANLSKVSNTTNYIDLLVNYNNDKFEEYLYILREDGSCGPLSSLIDEAVETEAVRLTDKKVTI